MNKPLNLAFLGCGFATSLHSRTISRIDKSVRRFYASRDKKKAASYNKKFGGAGFFDSYSAAINSREIEAVLVATPPAQHLSLALQGLQADKHVIVEKPPFLHSSDFEKVMRESKKADKKVLVAENYYYKPLAVELRRILKQELIGEVLFIQVNALKLQKTGNWRDDASLAGKGALYEGGVHWVNFMANLGYSLSHVNGFQPGNSKGADRSYLVSFKYAEGPVGTLAYSWEIPSLFKGLRISRIYGKEGSITFESNGLFIIVKGKRKKIILPGFSDISGYRAMFLDFFESLRSGDEPLYTPELAQKDLELIEKIYSSTK
jgi:UDP-N-acetylglucosamine 3-dehydrogenase